MKEIALLLVTWAAFVAIYLWTHFDLKGRSVHLTVHLRAAAAFVARKLKKSEPETVHFEFPELSRGSSRENYENDLESERTPEAKVEDAVPPPPPLDAVTLAEEDTDRTAQKRRQLEKLKDLAQKAKSVPVPAPSRKRASRSQVQSERRSQGECEWRIQSKLSSIERAIKARRGECFLESIPEALVSRDSFTN